MMMLPGLPQMTCPPHTITEIFRETHGFRLDTDIGNDMEVLVPELELLDNVTVRVENETGIGEKMEPAWTDMIQCSMELLLEMERLVNWWRRSLSVALTAVKAWS